MKLEANRVAHFLFCSTIRRNIDQTQMLSLFTKTFQMLLFHQDILLVIGLLGVLVERSDTAGETRLLVRFIELQNLKEELVKEVEMKTLNL